MSKVCKCMKCQNLVIHAEESGAGAKVVDQCLFSGALCFISSCQYKLNMEGVGSSDAGSNNAMSDALHIPLLFRIIGCCFSTISSMVPPLFLLYFLNDKNHPTEVGTPPPL